MCVRVCVPMIDHCFHTNTIVKFSILYRQDNEMPPNITSHHHIETFLFPANSRNYNKAHHNTRTTFCFYMTAGLNCVSRVSYQKYCLKMIWLVLLIVFFYLCISLSMFVCLLVLPLLSRIEMPDKIYVVIWYSICLGKMFTQSCTARVN